MRRQRITDSDGALVRPGCTIRFGYGIPPVEVRAKVVDRDGDLVALTPGHNPASCLVSDLAAHVGAFSVLLEQAEST